LKTGSELKNHCGSSGFDSLREAPALKSKYPPLKAPTLKAIMALSPTPAPPLPYVTLKLINVAELELKGVTAF
jgi:hypothetical protein